MSSKKTIYRRHCKNNEFFSLQEIRRLKSGAGAGLNSIIFAKHLHKRPSLCVYVLIGAIRKRQTVLFVESLANGSCFSLLVCSNKQFRLYWESLYPDAEDETSSWELIMKWAAPNCYDPQEQLFGYQSIASTLKLCTSMASFSLSLRLCLQSQ